MRLSVLLFLAGCVLIGACTFVYWRSRSERLTLRALRGNAPALLITCGVLLCGVSVIETRPAQTFAREGNPLVVAVAFDVSPSMLAVPDPQFKGRHAPRFERARDVLLAYFDSLHEAQQRPVVSMIGFTKQAELLMGWDQSTSQIRDVLQYGLVPDLLGSSGSSIESALRKVTDAFRMLPAQHRDSSRKLAIVVSDGESSAPSASLEYALRDLASSNYDVISLQAGLLNAPEGVPSFGDLGEFLGFATFSGRIYTLPDASTMQSIAESAVRGLYVRAEDPGAVEQMIRFSIQSERLAKSIDAALLLAIGMFATAFGIAVYQIR